MTTDKQIIIDGVDVSECELNGYYECYLDPIVSLCKDNPNCYYKQLARKTQECEGLENNLHIANTNHEAAESECDSYLRALLEIEKYTRTQFCDNCENIGSTEYNSHCEYCEYQEYFDIISKVKGENSV